MRYFIGSLFTKEKAFVNFMYMKCNAVKGVGLGDSINQSYLNDGQIFLGLTMTHWLFLCMF
jgi:hypothetical protein